MMSVVRSWAKENATLIYFLIAQAIALTGGAAWGLTYMVNLESRVRTLEVRGSPHLAEINTRLTTLESTTTDNKRRLENVVEIMTRRLNINP